MSPFEDMYGRKCKVPIILDSPVDRITWTIPIKRDGMGSELNRTEFEINLG